MMLRTMIAGWLLMLAACVTPQPAPPQPNIYVMRHLHTPAGVSDPDLTAEGQRHALAVSDWFRRDPPDVIYVSRPKRAQQTAAPLAARLRLTPKVYDPKDTAALVASVKAERGTVLIVGHSNTVPDIVEQLGGTRPGPLVHEDFGDIWHIAGPNHVTTRTKLSL
jgi:broad specificity phosphatase PhoE